MGAETSKGQTKEHFTLKEQQILNNFLKKLSGGKDQLAVKTLKEHITQKVNDEFSTRLVHALVIKKDVTVIPISSLITRLGSLLKGDLENKVALLLNLAGGNSEGIRSTQLIKYISSVLEAYIQFARPQGKGIGWSSGTPDQIEAVAQAILHDLLFESKSFKEVWENPVEDRNIDYSAVEKWYIGSSMFANLHQEVLRNCFPYAPPVPISFLPQISLTPKVFPDLLCAEETLFLNSCLPATLQHEWRFIYSTSTHGMSFSLFMKQIVDKGPTLLILEDQSGNRFGAFASESWQVRPQFHGTHECFMFALSPRVGVFHTTGYNTNFMYLNYLEKNTMPNGLGIGGREELFGIWLDYDFGKGKIAPTCTTFRSPQLSPHTDIDVRRLEVWALGPEEEDSDEEEGTRKKKSALDKDPEARAMLEMMGRGPVSDGYRDEEPED
ncbi:MTOR-associated protein MEAK7-like isoform X1 [Oratosquilla oratoria]|uniref:MTOR-associated protein MEAK7-like isoform X1 n=1 Tax=Oratosquilla oratoria TaxID=337810 RepID=UPI003F75CDA4